MKVRIALSTAQAEALRRVAGEQIPGCGGVANQTWGVLVRLGLVVCIDLGDDGHRYDLTEDGRDIAARLRHSGATPDEWRRPA